MELKDCNIEAPPKDGREILAYRYDGDFFMVRWAAPCQFMTQHEFESCDMSDEELNEPDWFFADFIQGGRLTEGFTHWIEPIPPKEAT